MTSWPTVRLRRCAAALSSPVSLWRYRSGSQGAMVPSSHVEDVLPQSGFVVVDEHRRADVHGGDEHEALADPADAHLLLHLVGDVDDLLALLGLEPQVVGVMHSTVLGKRHLGGGQRRHPLQFGAGL